MEFHLIGAAVAAYFVLCGADSTLLHFRRKSWHQIRGSVLSTRYIVCGENAYPTAIVSYFIKDRGAFEKPVQLRGIDFGGIEPGCFVTLLVHPSDPERCLVNTDAMSF